MSIKVYNRSEAYKSAFLKLALVGPAKKWKTRTAATSETPFFLSCGDGGMISALDILEKNKVPEPWYLEICENVDSTKPEAWYQIKAIVDAFATGDYLEPYDVDPNKYKTFVLDHWTDAGGYLYNEGVAKMKRELTKDGIENSYIPYAHYKDEGRRFFYKLSLLAQKMNVVIIFHLEEKTLTNPKTGKEFLQRQRPMMDGQALENIMPPWFSAMVGMEVKNAGTPNEHAVLVTRPDGDYNKLDCLGSRFPWPTRVERPNLTDIAKYVRGEK